MQKPTESAISTYSVPMQHFEADVNIADILLNYTAVKGKPYLSDEYKSCYTTVRSLMKGKPSKKKREILTQAQEERIATFIAKTPAIKSFYSRLSTREILILLEILGITTNTSVLGSYGMNKALQDTLLSPRISDALKFAIICYTYNSSSVALWICLTDGGRLIPSILKTLEETFQHSIKQTGTNEEVIATLLWDAMLIGKNSTDSHGGRVLDNFDNTILTSEVLALLIEKYRTSEMYSNLTPVSELAKHARRLHNFDESIPDEWTLKAFC